ncbi:hypothetical protein N7509_000137 [Penicillium cosmopolitanum]|uniref:Uncharacterized protein n=1 Tax=Penicillium cosmopolitanum TaxID=1131564 RepID=A0A9X0BFE3_9EURO|nr:uncharacterized protein N7509_000137 [Penicillium cosmopolitanum]KAJ5415039.1 hypothetical protein N7509_000137 [Penicillium cosmopolitanum]
MSIFIVAAIGNTHASSVMSTSATLQGRMVGPLDKRRRMTRCLSCAKRRIKVWIVKLKLYGIRAANI